ncbi:MAG: AraC family transcriptional regulator [Saprospiraceae bacterium]|nr:AraC family transcriptional regulator [Saprospiraceae bacterium]
MPIAKFSSTTDLAAREEILVLVQDAEFKAYRNLPFDQGELGIEVDIRTNIIQFYFALEGDFSFTMASGYNLQLKGEHNFLFYNPIDEMSLKIVGPSNGRLVAFFLTVDKMHRLFQDAAHTLPFLENERFKKKIYETNEYSSAIHLSLMQLFSDNMNDNFTEVFSKAKIYESLSYYFDTKSGETNSCPFLKIESDMSKIKKAKSILVSNMDDPPSLKDLSREVGISEYKLKRGFTEVYGDSAYRYLLEYKLGYAKNLLDQGQHQVNEVAYELGYTNPSHFITAFKKRYGMTPKKYMQLK